MSEPEHSKLISEVEYQLDFACNVYLQSDRLSYAVTLVPLPSGVTWVFSLLLYVLIPGTGEIEGVHLGQFLDPYSVSPELIHHFVGEFAKETEKARKEIRDALQADSRTLDNP